MVNFLLENWKDIMLAITGFSTGLLLIGEKWRALLREPFKRKQEDVASKSSEFKFLEEIVNSQNEKLVKLIDENNDYFLKAEEQRKKFSEQIAAKDLMIERMEVEFMAHVNEQKAMAEQWRNLLNKERLLVKKYKEHNKYIEGILVVNKIPFRKLEE